MGGELKNRIAVITGASAGIGAAVAYELARHGVRLVLNARRADRLAALESAILERDAAPPIVSVPGDCADPALIERMFDVAEDRFGAGVDLVVANAGRGLSGSLVGSDTFAWEELIRTNLLGVARLLRSAARRMVTTVAAEGWQEHARDIVVLGSVVGRHVSPFSSMYGSTKFAAHSLAEALRRELGPQGIRVTLVEPAIVASEFQDVAGYSQELVAGFDERYGPLLSPADVARVIRFAVSQPPAVHVSNLLVRPTRQDYP